MAAKTLKIVSPEISLLLSKLEERGFKKVQAGQVAEVLEQAELRYDADEKRFYGTIDVSTSDMHTTLYTEREYTKREEQPGGTVSPDQRVIVEVGPSDIFNIVSSYLLGNSLDDTFVDEAPFLPDPSEPTTDLVAERERREQKTEQAETRRRARAEIKDSFAAQEDVSTAIEGLVDYFTLCEEHMPGLVLPGKGEDLSGLRAYFNELFTEAVKVRGTEVLANYILDLERIAQEGFSEATAAFVRTAPVLYRQLSAQNTPEFVEAGISKLKIYNGALAQKKENTSKEMLEKKLEDAVNYFALQSEEAKQTIIGSIVKEHEDLVPLYTELKRESRTTEANLQRTQAGIEALRKKVEEKTRDLDHFDTKNKNLSDDLQIVRGNLGAAERQYAELKGKYEADSAALEKEREKSQRTEEALREKSALYDGVVKERNGLNVRVDHLSKEVESAFEKNLNIEASLAREKSAHVDAVQDFAYEMLRYEQTIKDVDDSMKVMKEIINSSRTEINRLQGEFKSYKSTAMESLATAKKWGIASGAAAIVFAAIASLTWGYSPNQTHSTSYLNSYDPRGKSLRALENDLNDYLAQKERQGEVLTNLGPGCPNVLEKLYPGMGGVAEGRDYFVTRIALKSKFCDSIPLDKKIDIGGKK